MTRKTIVVQVPSAMDHNPDPAYLRQLLKSSGLSQRIAASEIGMTYVGFRNYLRPIDHPLYREAPYSVQFVLEALSVAGKG